MNKFFFYLSVFFVVLGAYYFYIGVGNFITAVMIGLNGFNAYRMRHYA